MPACCVIAAFILAQCLATLRRWGMFWGLVRVPEGETAETLFSVMRAYLLRPTVRAALAVLVVVEAVALASWLYVAHGEHIAQLADIGWQRLHGRQVVYSETCGRDGIISQRVVIPIASERGS